MSLSFFYSLNKLQQEAVPAPLPVPAPGSDFPWWFEPDSDEEE